MDGIYPLSRWKVFFAIVFALIAVMIFFYLAGNSWCRAGRGNSWCGGGPLRPRRRWRGL